MSRNTFVLIMKIQRELCHRKNFGTFEKRSPGPGKKCGALDEESSISGCLRHIKENVYLKSKML